MAFSLSIFSSSIHGASAVRDLDEVSLGLGGDWKIAYDRENTGLQQGWQNKRPGNLYDIRVPSCFEETREGAGYDGVVWYFTNFTIPNEFTSKTLYIEFGAVNYACRVWLNGVEIGGHMGGYHRFRLPLGSAARPKDPNELVVRVVDPGRKPADGLTLRGVPNGKESWYFNFGGIYRPVRLLGLPPLSVEDVAVIADPKTGKVTVEVEIEKRPGAPKDVPLQIKIVSMRDQSKVISSAEQRPALESASNRTKVELTVPNPELWSPESPALYRLTATLGNLSQRTVEFGFRSFTIENGEFRLNGKPVFIRSVLYQPYYPMTLAYPPSEDFVRREVEMMREAGFNLVRIHAAVAPPALLRRADQMGLMAIEEPSLGWVYGPLDQIANPCLAEVTEMVRRDRNHPSVVAWGTISQGGGDLAKMGELLARRALQIDPTRPVFGDWPARWVEASAQACFVYLPGRAEPLAIGGGQMFPRSPLTDDDYGRLNTLGTTSSLDFLAAVGSGGVANLRNDLGRFGGRDFLEDYQLLRRYFDSAQKDFAGHRMQEMANGLDGLLQEGQGAQEAASLEILEALRSNPNLNGYCYSQWRDAAWECGPGICDIFGNWKQVAQAFRRVNQPVYVVLRFTPAATSLDRPVQLRAIVINDGGLSGQGRLEIALYRADGRELPRQKVPVELSDARRVTPLLLGDLRMDGPTGFCRVRVELYDASNKKLAETERRFLYVAAEQWDLSKHDLLVIDPTPARRSILAASGVRVLTPPSWPRSRTVLVSASGPTWQSRDRVEPLGEILEGISAEGGTLLLDCSAGLDPAVGRVRLLDGKTVRNTGGFIGRFCFVGAPPWLGWWFPSRQAMMAEYRSVIPQTAIMTEAREWAPQMAVVDGYARFGGFVMAERYWGAGKVIAFTLPIFDLVDRDPTARLLCATLLRYCGEHQRSAAPGNFERRQLVARFEGVGETMGSDWWIAGPYQCRDIRDGIQRSYPPDKEIEALRLNADQSIRPATWRSHHSPEAGRIKLSDVLGERSNTVAYVLTNIHAKKETRTTLRLGSDDAMRVYLNGRQVFENVIQRSGSPDQDRTQITVRQGWNQLVLKIVNASGPWEGYVSIDEPVVWSPERLPPKPVK
jgi:hypothetical protein